MVEPVYVEIGKRWSYAGALEWPGWCRHAKGDGDPVAALASVATRYRDALAPAGLAFEPPVDASKLEIVEYHEGVSGTEWGVPSVVPDADRRPLDGAETARLAAILEASWDAFDAAVGQAEGHELRKGPKGGGRSLEGIVGHCLEGDKAYLSKLGSRRPKTTSDDWRVVEAGLRERVLETFRSRAAGRVVREPSRTRELWLPRFYVRYVAWHTLVHAWEIADRRID